MRTGFPIGRRKSRRETGPVVRRIREPGLSVTIIQRDGLEEFHITMWPLPGERAGVFFWRLETFLRRQRARVVRHEVFGSVAAHASSLRCLNRLFGEVDWPVTWVEGGSCEGECFAGMHLLAVANVPVQTVFIDGVAAARTFTDGWARHCILGALSPTDRTKPPADQTSQVFRQMERALLQTGMTLSDVARTWLFLDKIVSWYGLFNTARTEIFSQRNLFAKGVPASTGIGARNPFRAALVAGAWGVKPLDGPMRIYEVASPLQCPARRYGSCFSRAVELTAPGHRRLLVSGTASISADGQTAHVGDLERQIYLTMDVVAALLGSHNLDWPNVTRATAYLKNGRDAFQFARWCSQHRLVLPVIVTQADICRDDLLFEIEVDAFVPTRLELKSEQEP